MSFETPPQPNTSQKPAREEMVSDMSERCIDDVSFQEQLQKETHIEYVAEDGKHYACAYTEIIPERLQHERPIFFIGGFGTGAITYTEQLHALAQHGRRVVYCNPVKGMPPSSELLAYTTSHNLPELLAEKAQEVLFLKERLCFGNADIIGHSQGGAVGTLITAFAPDEIRELILDTPAGLAGEATRTDFIIRAYEEMREERKFAQEKDAQGDSTYTHSFTRNASDKKIFDELAWRMVHEIPTIGKVSIVELLKEIQTSDEGTDTKPYVALITAQNDKLFPPQDIETHIARATHGEAPTQNILDSWVMYVDPHTGHGAFAHHDPELVRTMLAQGNMHEGRASVILDLVRQGEAEQARNEK